MVRHGAGGSDLLTRTKWIALVLLLVCAPSPVVAQDAASRKNLLVLYWYGRDYPSNVLYEQGLLRALGADPRGGPEYYSEYLDVDRFPEAEQARLMRDYIRQKYAHHRIDVIVASGETPFGFLVAEPSLFAGVPIVYTAIGPVDAAAERTTPGVAGVFITGVYGKTLEAMRAIHPDAEQVFVITSLPNNGGKARETIVRNELAPYANGLKITYLTDLPTSELIDRLSHAPPKSLVLYGRHAEDSSGGLNPVAAASLLARVSSVPMYGIARPYFGQGIVGGYLADPEVIGAQAGELALRVLSGARPETLHATHAALTPMFDWRALERWNISPARLPAGSDIRFRVPAAWDEYRYYIFGGITLLILQGLTIAALVVQRSRRRDVEARSAAILSAAPDMMFLLDRNGVYLDYHAPDETKLLMKPESFLGRHMIEVLPANVAASFASAFARLADEPGPVIVEYPLTLPDGEHHYEARVVPCRRNEVLAVVRDVTAQKRSQRALNETQSDLSRVSRLTALGEFAASIAHEIRQPLTGILVNASTCLRWLSKSTPDLAEIRDSLSDIVEAGQRANEIIRRNRELFRHHTVQMTLLDIRDVIREVETLARTRLQSSNVRLMTVVTGDVPAVYGDRVELQQVLLNLVGNSIDALEGIDAGARLIEIASSVSPDGAVKVSVRDTGVGLAGVDRERMFALAYTTKPSGSGVGLSISRSIIEAHGGRLWAEEATQGAIFSFTLPVHSPAATIA